VVRSVMDEAVWKLPVKEKKLSNWLYAVPGLFMVPFPLGHAVA
jgi:hypothetical protein